MGDPFLRAHYVAPRVFNVSGKLTPVSLKDQMIRARLLVDRAVENAEISSAPDHGLLVIGAGACGITAAIRAAELGVAATVLEKSPRLFSPQATCSTRWLDPSQYDWPLEHWTQGHFPWAGATMPLYFLSDWANRLAHLWRLHLHAASVAFRPLLKVHVSAHLAGPTPFFHSSGSSTIDATYVTAAGTQIDTFGAVLVSTGFGSENTKVGSAYRGFAFWETDPYGSVNLRLPLGASPRVLISGGGDGALQDFLRIATGKSSAREVFDACGIPPTIAAALKDIERRTACSYHWGENAGHDHALHMELEQEHNAQVAVALSDAAVCSKLGALLGGMPDTFKLVHTCQHLTPFYALNRFLVLLIARYVEQTTGTSIIEQQTALTTVSAAAGPHSCASAPSQCHGEDHDVGLSHWPYCADKTASAVKATEQYNVVIVRHGIAAGATAFAALTPIAQPRQVLPYYLL